MDDYADIDTVEGLLPKGLKIDDGASDPPSRAAVQTWIPKQTGQVNVAFATGGSSTPLTDADLLAMLSLVCSRELVFQIMATRAVHSDTKVPAYIETWHKDFDAMLKAASEGDLSATSADGSLPWCSNMDADETDPSDSRNPSWTKEYVP